MHSHLRLVCLASDCSSCILVATRSTPFLYQSSRPSRCALTLSADGTWTTQVLSADATIATTLKSRRRSTSHMACTGPQKLGPRLCQEELKLRTPSSSPRDLISPCFIFFSLLFLQLVSNVLVHTNPFARPHQRQATEAHLSHLFRFACFLSLSDRPTTIPRPSPSQSRSSLSSTLMIPHPSQPTKTTTSLGHNKRKLVIYARVEPSCIVGREKKNCDSQMTIDVRAY